MPGGMLHQQPRGGDSARSTVTGVGEMNVRESNVPVLVVAEWSAAGSSGAEGGLSGGGCDPAVARAGQAGADAGTGTGTRARKDLGNGAEVKTGKQLAGKRRVGRACACNVRRNHRFRPRALAGLQDAAGRHGGSDEGIRYGSRGAKTLPGTENQVRVRAWLGYALLQGQKRSKRGRGGEGANKKTRDKRLAGGRAGAGRRGEGS